MLLSIINNYIILFMLPEEFDNEIKLILYCQNRLFADWSFDEDWFAWLAIEVVILLLDLSQSIMWDGSRR